MSDRLTLKVDFTTGHASIDVDNCSDLMMSSKHAIEEPKSLVACDILAPIVKKLVASSLDELKLVRMQILTEPLS